MDPLISNDPQVIHLIQWAFYALLTGCAVIVTNTMITMKNSIIELNATMARVIETQQWHEKEIDRVEQRVDRMESKHH